MRDIFVTRLMQPSSARHSLLMGPIDVFLLIFLFLFFYARGPRPCNQWEIEKAWFGAHERIIFEPFTWTQLVCVTKQARDASSTKGHEKGLVPKTIT